MKDLTFESSGFELSPYLEMMQRVPTPTEVLGKICDSFLTNKTSAVFYLTNDEEKKIVDLPGFGYAKASKQDQNAWAKLILSYLEKRAALTDLILIMDMRHPFQNKDLEFLSLCNSLNLPIHLVLTKADKLNNKETQNTLKVVSEKMADYPTIVDSLVFSATKKIGLETLLNKIKLLLEV